eukprot:CAMPEP_0113918078 /NCGR_PEP_ID=MMETSP0780_2-20120614/33129_1 /TAXON_ID=652834 /ORGANISM="Palpitomonas bilix" /LENGTH=166 /DNA_ID=CAMNT_0000917801 /DNA_START=132 /DNA_END=632 /DNA_ORIENTATION=- /assembly_acc=CAM_ASM_000599
MDERRVRDYLYKRPSHGALKRRFFAEPPLLYWFLTEEDYTSFASSHFQAKRKGKQPGDDGETGESKCKGCGVVRHVAEKSKGRFEIEIEVLKPGVGGAFDASAKVHRRVLRCASAVEYEKWLKVLEESAEKCMSFLFKLNVEGADVEEEKERRKLAKMNSYSTLIH